MRAVVLVLLVATAARADPAPEVSPIAATPRASVDVQPFATGTAWRWTEGATGRGHDLYAGVALRVGLVAGLALTARQVFVVDGDRRLGVNVDVGGASGGFLRWHAGLDLPTSSGSDEFLSSQTIVGAGLTVGTPRWFAGLEVRAPIARKGCRQGWERERGYRFAELAAGASGREGGAGFVVDVAGGLDDLGAFAAIDGAGALSLGHGFSAGVGASFLVEPLEDGLDARGTVTLGWGTRPSAVLLRDSVRLVGPPPLTPCD